ESRLRSAYGGKQGVATHQQVDVAAARQRMLRRARPLVDADTAVDDRQRPALYGPEQQHDHPRLHVPPLSTVLERRRDDGGICAPVPQLGYAASALLHCLRGRWHGGREVPGIHASGRIQLSRPPAQWIREALGTGVRLAELSQDVAIDAGGITRTSL